MCHVCEHVCEYMCVCSMCVLTYAGQRLTSRCLFSVALCQIILREDLSPRAYHFVSARMAGQQVLGLLVSLPLCPGISFCVTMPSFYMSAGDLNLVPHVLTASTLPTEHFPSTLVSLCNTGNISSLDQNLSHCHQAKAQFL